jgi:hypothetical protein
VLVAATALYVGSEAGVTGWVVRYFSPMTTVLAPVALTLFWAGLAVGRIVSARISHRFDLGGCVGNRHPEGSESHQRRVEGMVDGCTAR